MELTLEKPNPKQDLFLRDTHKHVAFGGARGGGKSWAIRFKAVVCAVKYDGITICIVRRSYPELQENHIKPLRRMLHCGTRGAVARYSDQKKEMTFVNGSQILFRYCDKEKDLENFQGTQFDLLFLDEATQLTEEQMREITACVRGVNNFPKRIYYTCNPGGRGHGYIKRIFIDRKFEDGENPEDYNFIQSLVTDNLALMESNPDYIKQLEALPAKIKKAWLYGDWNIFEGAFFEEFKDDPAHYEDRRWTHVIDPFEIPPNWKIYRSYDFGYAKPFACHWYAIDQDGIAYCILEYYGCTGEPNVGLKWDPHQQFKKMREIEDQHPWLKGKKIIGIADPAIWNSESGESVADIAAKYRIYFQPGDHQRIAGWMQMHYRFSFDEEGIPMMYIFSNCVHAIRTLPLMMYDEHSVEDLDSSLEDHIADEMRYFCMARPITPRTQKKEIPVGFDPLNQRVRKKKSNFISI